MSINKLTNNEILSNNPLTNNVDGLSFLQQQTGSEIHRLRHREITEILTGEKKVNYIQAELNSQNISQNLEMLEPIVNKAAQKYGINPALINSIITLESGGKIDAVSPTGPLGVMQLSHYLYDPKITQFFKTPINPFNPEEAIDRGVAFLAYLNDKYNGNIEKMVAAYNQGENVIDKAVKNSGENWKNNIPSEANNYINNISGMLHLQHPKIYNQRFYKNTTPKPKEQKKENPQEEIKSDDLKSPLPIKINKSVIMGNLEFDDEGNARLHLVPQFAVCASIEPNSMDDNSAKTLDVGVGYTTFKLNLKDPKKSSMDVGGCVGLQLPITISIPLNKVDPKVKWMENNFSLKGDSKARFKIYRKLEISTSPEEKMELYKELHQLEIKENEELEKRYQQEVK